MSTIVRVAVGALGLAGNCVSVPGLAAGATLADAIQRECEKVATHKHACKQLANKAAELQTGLDDARRQLQDPYIMEALDTVEGTLRKVHGRTRKWARKGRISAFIHEGKIGKEIQQAEADIDVAFKVLQMKAATHQANALQEFKTLVLSSQAAVQSLASDDQGIAQTLAGVRESAMHVLSSPSDVRLAAELSGNDGIVDLLIEAGQHGLRDMRMKPQAESQSTAARPLPPQTTENYQRVMGGLAELLGATHKPPPVKTLDGEVVRIGEIPVAGGTYSDVWCGKWLGQHLVAIKSLRGVETNIPKGKEHFMRELDVWTKLDHPHILPILGIVCDIGHFFNMISPWQDNGNIIDFIKSHPEVNRHILLAEASDGLAYLHSQGVIHGNMRGTNILISARGKALICDFGMSTLIEDVTEQKASTTLTKSMSVRWLAPELFNEEGSSPSQASDTYSFAMTVLESITLLRPFADVKKDTQVLPRLLRRDIPTRPTDEDATQWLPDNLWKLMVMCWATEPSRRPAMSYVSNRMQTIAKQSGEEQGIRSATLRTVAEEP